MTSFAITLYGQFCRRHLVGQQVVSDVRCSWARHGIEGLPPKCRLATTLKHTGQESGGELFDIFTFW